MARRALIWHLFPVNLLVILASVIAVVAFSATSLRTFYLDQVSVDLQSRAALLKPQITGHLRGREDTALQNLCLDLGKASATRITVVLPSGEVVADSHEQPRAMDNHTHRPEIKRALQGDAGESTRFSDTLAQRMMYVAIPLHDSEELLGILRVALPITAIDDALWTTLVKILYGSAVVALLAAAANWFVSRRITRPLEELRRGAELFARGELNHQLTAHHSLEIDALAEAMNQMALDLNDRINTVIHQKQEQQAVLSSMVEGVVAVDGRENIISINETAAALFAITPESAIGRDVSELVRNSSFQDFVHLTLRSTQPVEEEITFHMDDERVYQAHGTVLKGESGQSIGAVIVLHDITRLRRLERVRRDFVSNVSHELRTPITSVKGFVETLLQNPPDDPAEMRRFLEIILKQANQLDLLVTDLLSLSRIEQGELGADALFEKMDMRRILDEVVETCSQYPYPGSSNIDITCESGLEANANASLLQQAVLNLVENAVKYSCDSGQPVEVNACAQEDRIVIQVRDHGPGIASEHLPRLFERFYRVDKSRSRELGGTGLGLAIVKHIVELHGGEVNVESTVGTGSTFTISLPG
jgi:two-component system, OmpR family, phosphate regulon sensor histidine kinase PhoR